MGDDPSSSLLSLPATAWLASNDLAFAILDRFPVSEGHTLVVPKRLVASWWDATEAEQHALLSLAEQVKQLLADRFAPDGWNLGVNIGRAEGHRAGLVVMATGLGKTWLAAFDTLDAAHTLFIAHHEEILQQSLEVFRQVQPDRRLGLATGASVDLDAEVVFASVQWLHRNLERIPPEWFDRVVVDEFHHAAARSCRKVQDHVRPRFLLGLTATPERLDGADLLALTGDNLVVDIGLVEGIERGQLVPFHYLGIRDDTVDDAALPWRAGHHAWLVVDRGAGQRVRRGGP